MEFTQKQLLQPLQGASETYRAELAAKLADVGLSQTLADPLALVATHALLHERSEKLVDTARVEYQIVWVLVSFW